MPGLTTKSRPGPDRGSPADRLCEFMRRYYQMHPSRAGHVSMEIQVSGHDRAEIASLYSDQRDRGHAGAVLGALVRHADALGVELRLHAVSLGLETGLGQRQLEEFYRRRGFEPTGRGSHMTRKPAVRVRKER